MKTAILFSFFIALVAIAFFNCSNSSVSPTTLKADTVHRPNEIIIRYNYDLDTLTMPVILETSTVMVTDSMKQLEEFRVLKITSKIYDSSNFMNCVNGETLIPVKFYTFSNNRLDCSIFIPGANGHFVFGSLQLDSNNNLIIGKGRNVVFPGYELKPIDRRIKLKIFVPQNITLNKVLFKCPQ